MQTATMLLAVASLISFLIALVKHAGSKNSEIYEGRRALKCARVFLYLGIPLFLLCAAFLAFHTWGFRACFAWAHQHVVPWVGWYLLIGVAISAVAAAFIHITDGYLCKQNIGDLIALIAVWPGILYYGPRELWDMFSDWRWKRKFEKRKAKAGKLEKPAGVGS